MKNRPSFCLLLVLTFLAASATPANNPRTSKNDLLDQIEDARKALRDEKVDVVKAQVGTRRVRIGRRKYTQVPVIGVVGREMAISVADPAGKIHIVRGIKRDKGLEVLTPGYILSVRRDNGFNSDIAVISPQGGRVLAVKYPVMNDRNRFGAGEPVIQAVYTPYSAEIKTPEVIERGIKVQDEFIDKAYKRLKERDVYSFAFSGRKVSDVIPKDLLIVLLANEHIDPSEFKSEAHTRLLVEQVLTIIGTNEDKAYAYTISPAGAFGLVQMIPSTYALLLRKYPAARLNPSFAQGMTDPINAVMAQILLCDSDWQAIRSVQEVDKDKIGPYLAAAYNGGVGRVLNVLRHEETGWMDEPEGDRRPTMTVTRRVPVRVRKKAGKRSRTQTVYVTRSYTQPIFRSETSKYVRQYHWIEDFFKSRKTKESDR
jgi:hypothetical protein